MPLDITPPRQQTTTAELHYLIRTPEKPARYVMEPPLGVPAWNGVATLVRNFYDPDEIKSVYYPEVQRWLGNTGCVTRRRIRPQCA